MIILLDSDQTTLHDQNFKFLFSNWVSFVDPFFLFVLNLINQLAAFDCFLLDLYVLLVIFTLWFFFLVMNTYKFLPYGLVMAHYCNVLDGFLFYFA